MEAPRTHYQVSFTAKQALSLFVGLLAALAVAYFFGLMTGLSGNEPQEAGAAPSRTPAAEEAPPPAARAGERVVFPAPVTAVAAAPAPASRVHVFEDGEGGAPARRSPRSAAASAPAPPAPAAGTFRVQVISVSSRAEAEAEAKRLSRRGFSARVEPGGGAKGRVYRVRVGPFASREEAFRATERLEAAGRRETWIVPPGQ